MRGSGQAKKIMSKQTHALGWMIISIIILAFIVFALKYSKVEVGDGLTITTKISRPKIFKDLDKKAVLSLITQEKEVAVGETVNVSIYLDTQGKLVDGVDVILKYDTIILKAKDKEVKKGEVFSNVMTNEIDQKTGLIKFSALSQPGQTFSGTGTLVTLNFKALRSGQTAIAFVFEKGSTEETNVASQGKDILKEVKNLELIIN